ncbi:MAG TPA: maleylpyruvate isomerase N-terminal domain-containing protein [Blastocatellia bacterium]|nr:maleylpyruvate isomerase N-terminal domain-containing protein [Blastocatellia bacterium]
MKPVEPIHTVELFPPLHAQLLDLLRGLKGDDWNKPTAAPLWSVKDIAAHLLDTDIRRLSFQRDGLPLPEPDAPIEHYRGLVDFLNQLNADWVKAARRVSPNLLIAFLEITGEQIYQLFQSLDPQAPARWAVSWAGEEQSLNWFDIAREYTEKWHHQQQIRDAVGAPGLTGRRWLHPVLDTFLRGLPHTYRDVEAKEGSDLAILITGEAGGEWTLRRTGEGWRLYMGRSDAPVCSVELDQDTAWRLFTKGLSREAARPRVHVQGDEGLGNHFLNLLAVMA